MSTDLRARPQRLWLIVAAAVIGVAIIVVVVLAGNRVNEYEPGTPEAAAQAYLQALFDDDYDAAHALLAPALQTRCTPYDLSLDEWPDVNRAVFDQVRNNGGTAVITLQLTSTDYSPEPLPVVRTENIDSRLVLEMHDGEWRIVDAEWPLDACARRQP